MMAGVCPTCGQPLATHVDFRRLGDAMPMGPIERRLFNALAERPGRWITNRTLVNAAYFDDPTGGPDDADGSIKVILSHLRRRLDAAGLVIETRRSGVAERRLWFADPEGQRS
jgi:DNA-binding response OmpR family regulator